MGPVGTILGKPLLDYTDHMGPHGFTRKDKTDYAGIYWTIRDNKGLYKAKVDHTRPYRSILDCMGSDRTLRDQMGPYGTIQVHGGQ